MVVGVAAKLTMLAAGIAVVTVTVAALVALVPPAPLQLKVKLYVPAVLMGPTVVPVLEVPTAPPHVPVPPPAVHPVALVLVQLKVVEPPV